jgi:hypothetical protein
MFVIGRDGCGQREGDSMRVVGAGRRRRRRVKRCGEDMYDMLHINIVFAILSLSLLPLGKSQLNARCKS